MISFCLITRNCAKTLPATLASIKPVADEICIVDGGSTDGTVEVAKHYGARVEIAGPAECPDWYLEIPDGKGGTQITLANFAHARNRSFDMAKGDAIFWIDADDHLDGIDHWTHCLRTFRDGQFDAMVLLYEYMFNAAGKCITRLWRERLLRNRPDLRWIDPIHETIPVEGKRLAVYHGLRVVHHKHERTDVNSRRNLEVLKARANPASSRTFFYLGVEHIQAKEYEAGANALEQYLTISFDPDETYQALLYLGELHRLFGKWEEAITRYLKATTVQPRWRDAYVGLSMIFAAQGDWARAIHYGEQARGLDALPDTALCVDPQMAQIAWIRPLAEGYRGLGRLDEALSIVRDGLAREPGHADLLALRDNVTRQMNHSLASAAATSTIEGLLRTDQGYKAGQVAQLLGDESAMGSLATQALGAAARGELPGRSFRNIDLLEEANDERVRWMMEWMGERPNVWSVASPGCGEGMMSRIAYELLQKRVTAWDPNPWPSQNLGGISPISMSGTQLVVAHQPLLPEQIPPETPYDLVIVENVLEHTAHPEPVVRHLIGLAKPGGTVLVCVKEAPFDPDGPSPSWTNLRLHPFTGQMLKRITGTWAAPIRMHDPQRHRYLASWIDLPRTAQLASWRIGIYCGSAVEPWDWTVLDRGCGASEEAVIRLSRILASRGHGVTVFGDAVGEDVGPHGRVAYVRRTDYEAQDLCIVWRAPEVLLQRKAPEAEWTWLWLQDNLDPGLVEAAAARADRVLLMSGWHGTLYPNLGRKRVVVGNGIDRTEVLGEIPDRVASRFIWASCPTRGLDTLLEYWPEIRRRVPGAELEVYYGLEMITALLPYKDPETQKALSAKIAKIESLSNQPGVKWIGRVSVKSVTDAMKRAGVWAYPTSFLEGFCATAARAQACGCWPVIFERAALAETVAWGWTSTPESFVDDCVAAVHCSDDRMSMQAWARAAFAWERVADKFERMMEVG
jgi:glycosyltransferase involved in cell wall biosynthesis/tetratricopeptide (TPR) repeat protein